MGRMSSVAGRTTLHYISHLFLVGPGLTEDCKAAEEPPQPYCQQHDAPAKGTSGSFVIAVVQLHLDFPFFARKEQKPAKKNMLLLHIEDELCQKIHPMHKPTAAGATDTCEGVAKITLLPSYAFSMQVR